MPKIKRKKKLRILVSNDDGINSHGILALARALSRIAHVTVCAPEREQSTMGHALTLHKPVRIFHVGSEKNLDLWATSGTPADCVYVGIRYVMKERPDFVISGINRGVNVGNDIYFSGTIAAAREGAVIDVPAIACSLDYHYEPGLKAPPSFEWAADYIVDLVKQLEVNPVPMNCLLNVNFPNIPFEKLKGVKVARQGFRIYTDRVEPRTDNRGKKYFWLGGQYAGYKQIEGSDCEVLDQGYISITPFRIDLTQYDYMETLSNWVPDPHTRKPGTGKVAHPMSSLRGPTVRVERVKPGAGLGILLKGTKKKKSKSPKGAKAAKPVRAPKKATSKKKAVARKKA